MPDTRVRAAVEHWGPRMTANGVDYNDLVRTSAAVTRWSQWLDAWTAVGRGYESEAARARSEGHLRTAGEYYLQAALSHHFAKFVWVVDPERNRQATADAVRTLRAALALLDPVAERIPTALGVGNLRRPSVEGRAPVVILIPGLDSTKEEFHAWESVFLVRGMATISFDGPGQGETGFESPIRPDYEVAVAALLDALMGRPGLDLDRVGAVGVSLGGYYAARSAAFESRIKAVAGISGPYDLGAVWPTLPALTRDTFAHHSWAGGDDAGDLAAELSLAGVAELIEQPCLVVTGRRDGVIPWEETKRIADDAPRSEWVLFEEGTHVCNNIPLKYRPLVADWTRERLG